MTLKALLDKYSKEFGIYLEITDNNAKALLCCKEPNNIDRNEYVFNDPNIIHKTKKKNGKEHFYKYTPIEIDEKSCGYFLMAGENKALISTASVSFKLTCELLLAGSSDMSMFSNLNKRNTLSNMLINNLLDSPNSSDIPQLINQLELDTTMMYAVICINYDFQINQYFNINLNLGYSESIRDTQNELFNIMRHYKFFNTRDVVAEYGKDKIVILKSIQSSSNIGRAYKMLDIICTDIKEALSNFPLLRTHIAHSDFFSGLDTTKEHFDDAQMIIMLGEKKTPQNSYYKADDLFMDIFTQRLPKILSIQCIRPISDALIASGRNIASIINSCDKLLDCGLNQSLAAETLAIHRNTLKKRMDSWVQLTGLNPETNFIDGIKSKLVILDIKTRYPEIIL